VPAWMMCASKVSRSTMAAQSRGSVKVRVHSEKAGQRLDMRLAVAALPVVSRSSQ